MKNRSKDKSNGEKAWVWIMVASGITGALIAIYPTLVFIQFLVGHTPPEKVNDTLLSFLRPFLFVDFVAIGACLGVLAGNQIGFEASFRIDFGKSRRMLERELGIRK